jgi:hypothetical protein
MDLSETYKQMKLSESIKKPARCIEGCARCGNAASRYNVEGNLEPLLCPKCGHGFSAVKPSSYFDKAGK